MSLFKNAHRIYFPVHFVLLLMRYKKFRQNPTKSALRAFKGWLKSCIFATLFACSYPFVGTYLPVITGHPFNSMDGFLVCFAFSWFILLEPSSRWSEMGIWVLANWFESMVYSLRKRKLLIEIPGFNVSSSHFRSLTFLRKLLWPSQWG